MSRECSTCNTLKNENMFEGNRSKCKACRSIEAKERRSRKKKEDIVRYKCYEMASSAYSRVNAKSREYKKGYQRLEEPFSFDNIPDFSDYLYDNFYNDIKYLLDTGEVPSVDRIDSNTGYTPKNVRILSHRENTLLGVEERKVKIKVTGPTGKETIYDSIEDCRVAFGAKYESYVRGWLKPTKGMYSLKGYVPPKGYTFERL